MFDVFVSKTTGGTINVVFFLDVPRFLGALNGFFSDFNRGLQKLPDVAPWQSEKYIYVGSKIIFWVGHWQNTDFCIKLQNPKPSRFKDTAPARC